MASVTQYTSFESAAPRPLTSWCCHGVGGVRFLDYEDYEAGDLA